MQRKIGVLRTTVVGGILFLAPLVATVFIVEKALGLASKLLHPILGHFPHKLLGFVAVSDLLAIVLLVVICFIAGLLARTVLARRLISTIEQRLLSNLPGYEFFKGLGESILGADGAANRQPVMVRFDDCHQLGFLMEHLDDGTCVVFLPGAPNPYSGGVFYFSADRVQPVQVPPQTALKCLKRLGIGSAQLQRGELGALD